MYAMQYGFLKKFPKQYFTANAPYVLYYLFCTKCKNLE